MGCAACMPWPCLLPQRTAVDCHPPLELAADGQLLHTPCLCLYLPLPLSGDRVCPRRVQHYGWPAAAQGGTIRTGACLGP